MQSRSAMPPLAQVPFKVFRAYSIKEILLVKIGLILSNDCDIPDKVAILFLAKTGFVFNIIDDVMFPTAKGEQRTFPAPRRTILVRNTDETSKQVRCQSFSFRKKREGLRKEDGRTGEMDLGIRNIVAEMRLVSGPLFVQPRWISYRPGVAMCRTISENVANPPLSVTCTAFGERRLCRFSPA